MARTVYENGELKFLKMYEIFPFTPKDLIINNELYKKDPNLYILNTGFQSRPFDPVPAVDLNNDPEIRIKMTKYFNDKFKLWIDKDYRDLHKYLKIQSDGKIRFVKTWDEYVNNEEINNIKTSFITDEIFNKNNMVRFLNKYVEKNNVDWFDLKKHKDKIKENLFKKLRSHMRKFVLERKNN